MAAADERAASLVARGWVAVVAGLNSIGTAWHGDDVAAIATSGADAIVVPKVNGAAEVQLGLTVITPDPCGDDIVADGASTCVDLRPFSAERLATRARTRN